MALGKLTHYGATPTDAPRQDHGDGTTGDVNSNRYTAIGPLTPPRFSERDGYVILFCSALFFEFAALVSRYVTVYHGVSVSNVVFLRGVIQLSLGILSALIFFSPRQVFTVPTSLLPLVAFRGIFGAASYAITYTALSLAPIGIVTSIFFLNPISTTIVSSFVLKEKISSTECYAASLSILGALLVANPTMEIPTKLSHDYLSGISLAFLSAMMVSAAFVSIRALGRRVHFMVNVISFAIGGTTLGVLLGGTHLTGTTKGLWMTVGGCVLGFFGQCLLNLGFQYARASTGSLLRNVDVPLAYILGIIFLGEVPHLVSIFGSSLVIVATIIVAMGAMKKKESSPKEEEEDEISKSKQALTQGPSTSIIID